MQIRDDVRVNPPPSQIPDRRSDYFQRQYIHANPDPNVSHSNKWSHGESNPDLSLAKAPFYR